MWVRAQWFKLHLAPKSLQRSSVKWDSWLPTLPIGKSICDVYADFFEYLCQCAREHIEESHAGGKLLWSSVEGNSVIILSHLNGWEGPQQALMRQAAIQGGLIRNAIKDHRRMNFITEGEVSLSFCLCSGLSKDAVKIGKSILVVDVGAGAIDTSGYVVKSVSPISVKAIFASECRMQGSVSVTTRAGRHDRCHSGSSWQGGC